MRALVVALALTGCGGSEVSQADLDALTTRVTALETENTQLRVDLTAATARLTAVEASAAATSSTVGVLQAVVTSDAAAVDNRLDDDEADIGDVQGAVGDIQEAWISGDTSWDVGPSGDYTTLAAAWAAAQEVRLAAGATLSIDLGSGNFPMAGALNLDHPDGERIFLTGNGSGTTTVTFATGGFVLDQQHRFGGFSGLGITSTEADTSDSGIWLSGASSTHVQDVAITSFAYGIRADQGSVVDGTGIEVHANDVGIYAQTGSVLETPGLDASTNNMGIGASFGGIVIADGVNATDDTNGAFAEGDSVIRANDGDFTGSYIGIQSWASYFQGEAGDFGGVAGGIGVEAEAGSSMEVGSSSITGTGYGVYAEDNSVVRAGGLSLASVGVPYTQNTGAVIHHP